MIESCSLFKKCISMFNNLTKITAWLLYATIVLLYAFSLWVLMDNRQEETLFSLTETLPILKYSLLQAVLSASISTILGILLAKAFFYLEFKGKTWLYKSILFVWSLPSLVIIFAVIGIWGNSGWIAQVMKWIGIDWHSNIYGLQGILIAHGLLNIPLVTKYCVEALALIPSSQYQLSAQLNLSGWNYFRIVEFPMFKRILPYVFLTIFMICFTSFPIVLMLGGGPKYSTLEVAIYQAVSFEFDFAKAVMLIMVQLAFGIVLQGLLFFFSQRALKQSNQTTNVELWKPRLAGSRKLGLQSILILQTLLILLPLVSVLWAGISVSHFWQRLVNLELWEATLFSVLISLIASITTVGVTYLIALETRQLLYRKHHFLHAILGSVATYPLILPVFLLAVGLFLLLMNISLSTTQLLVLVGVMNGIILIPYVYPMLFSSMWETFNAQDKLARSLGLSGFNRWWIAEKHYLVRPLANAFILAMSASLGSFAVIAFFGTADFSTLPYLLYQQLGSYRTEDASVTALMLMLFALLPFLFNQRTKISK